MWFFSEGMFQVWAWMCLCYCIWSILSGSLYLFVLFTHSNEESLEVDPKNTIEHLLQGASGLVGEIKTKIIILWLVYARCYACVIPLSFPNCVSQKLCLDPFSRRGAWGLESLSTFYKGCSKDSGLYLIHTYIMLTLCFTNSNFLDL